MARYIDADEALRMMRNVKADKPSYGTWDMACDCCIDCVEVVPTADVTEAVRCSECKYNPNYKRSKGMVWCRKFRQDVCSDGFCNYGERRTDDE